MQKKYSKHQPLKDFKNSIKSLKIDARHRQTAFERMLQAQLFTRIAFVTTQIQEIEQAVRERIAEHSSTLEDPQAECIIEAQTQLNDLAELMGSDFMELSAIARKDFMRIPVEFVHPLIKTYERTSQEFLVETLLVLSGGAPVTRLNETVGFLESLLEAVQYGYPAMAGEIEEGNVVKDRQMNYVKAQIFPILEIESSALDLVQVDRLLELQSSFNILHANFEYRINRAIESQAINLKIANSQLISRMGFVSDEINDKRNETINEINLRAAEIDDFEAECIVGSLESVENSAQYAGTNLMAAVGEAMFYINQIEQSYFYPLINVLQIESSIIQWTILSSMHRYNSVTEIERLISRLEDDYFVTWTLYEISIRNIEREVQRIDENFNEIKSWYFPQLNSHRDYFTFTANFIREDLSQCEATQSA
ncbi:CLUMA_CG008617, isoform A [Clunio marinus]|uniref:CLUMA_CG008617, isoform A n=1 Tax=Clunio marinus TaxID=568069 RepID=A0A1J1I4L7_9DIPT|nr:CLUMA_CG008617, isoform A [Clunio marinus]